MPARLLISIDALHRAAHWAADLTPDEQARAARGMVERSIPKGGYLCHVGDRLDCWVGLTEGLLKLSIVTRDGKSMTFAGIATGGWFGEGSLLKNEARRYDVIALRPSKLVMLERATFLWLFENSVGLNRYLVRHFNERLSQFMAQVQFDRTLNATERLARNIAWLFNPVFYPRVKTHIQITQEEVADLCGLSRQSVNQTIRLLEGAGLIRLENGGITVVNLAGLEQFGD
mgnify:CR=1 FL=1